MGIFTNVAEARNNADYQQFGVFTNEHANFVELGMLAVVECEMNRNAFDKAMALQELNALELNGNTDVLYEGVSLKGIWNKIKEIFRKIVEKIKKIFNTFIAKMSSMFMNGKKFAEKYKQRISDNWSKMDNEKDWTYKGYKYTVSVSKIDTENESITKALFGDSGSNITKFLENKITFDSLMKSWKGDYDNQDDKFDFDKAKSEIAEQHSKIKESQDAMRAAAIKTVSGGYSAQTVSSDKFSEEITKVFRDNETEKKALKWSDVASIYTSAENLCNVISKYDEEKKTLEANNKTFTESIEKLIKSVENAEDYKTDDAKQNEVGVAVAKLFTDTWSSFKEFQTAVYAGQLQAYKDNFSQAKAIAVKIISLGAAAKAADNKEEAKKEESKADEAADTKDAETKNTNESFNFDFIESVELV